MKTPWTKPTLTTLDLNDITMTGNNEDNQENLDKDGPAPGLVQVNQHEYHLLQKALLGHMELNSYSN